MKTNCDPRIENYMEMVETGAVRTDKEIKALVALVRRCFKTQDIYVNSTQLTKYLGLVRYFPFEELFPWQEFMIGLHLCTYWKKDNMPRWPDLLLVSGRGTGKDGTIAAEAVMVTSPYNGVAEYDVDICANNEEQAVRPVKDVVAAFKNHEKKLKKHYYWTTEKVVGLKTNSTILGRTNNPAGRDGMRSGMIVFNEIHEYKDYKNIDVFTTGLGKKPYPRSAYFTTQGYVRGGPLDDKLEEAYSVLFEDEPDNGLLPMIYKLDDKEEVHDEENWVKANPSLPYMPHLQVEMRKEYKAWLKKPYQLTGFIVKRMNLPSEASDMMVCEYEKIKQTNKELPDLQGKTCTCGIDFSKITDMVSVNLHFKIENERYDINHSWLCKQSKDIPRIKAPLQEWEKKGLLTIVDDVEIHPEIIVDYIAQMKQHYLIKTVAIDDFRYALLSQQLKTIGYDAKAYKNLKLVRPSDIMKVVPVIDSCFANDYFSWDDNPVLRWATNNTKLVRYGRNTGKDDDMDIGNFVYAKIEAKARKTDPFMALVASMTVEGDIPYTQNIKLPDIGVFQY